MTKKAANQRLVQAGIYKMSIITVGNLLLSAESFCTKFNSQLNLHLIDSNFSLYSDCPISSPVAC